MSRVTDSATPIKAATPPSRPPLRKTIVITVAVFICLAVPIVALMTTPLAVGAGTAALGMFATAIGVLVGGRRTGCWILLWNVVAVGLAPLGLVWPAIGVMFMVILGMFTGFAAHRGLDAPIYTLNILVALTMIAPPALTASELSDGVTVNSSYIAMLTLVTAIGGVWAYLCASVVYSKLPHPPRAPLHRESAIVYGASLALLTGIAAAVTLTWFPDSLTGWVILTIYIVFRPVYKNDNVVHGMYTRVGHRIVGTVGGVLVAAGIFAVIRNPNALVLIGLALVVIAVQRMVSGAPYWQFVVFLTPAVVLMTSNGYQVDHVALVRLVCTAVGIVMAVAALEFNRRFTFPWIAEAQRVEALQAAQQ